MCDILITVSVKIFAIKTQRELTNSKLFISLKVWWRVLSKEFKLDELQDVLFCYIIPLIWWLKCIKRDLMTSVTICISLFWWFKCRNVMTLVTIHV